MNGHKGWVFEKDKGVGDGGGRSSVSQNQSSFSSHAGNHGFEAPEGTGAIGIASLDGSVRMEKECVRRPAEAGKIIGTVGRFERPGFVGDGDRKTLNPAGSQAAGQRGRGFRDREGHINGVLPYMAKRGVVNQGTQGVADRIAGNSIDLRRTARNRGGVHTFPVSPAPRCKKSLFPVRNPKRNRGLIRERVTMIPEKSFFCDWGGKMGSKQIGFAEVMVRTRGRKNRMSLSDIFPNVITDFIVYLLVGLVSAYYFYEYRKRDLLGGLWGGAFIGMVGAVLVSMLGQFEDWFIRLVTWLMLPKLGDNLLFRVNLITAMIGSFVFVYILNQINHDRTRK